MTSQEYRNLLCPGLDRAAVEHFWWWVSAEEALRQGIADILAGQTGKNGGNMKLESGLGATSIYDAIWKDSQVYLVRRRAHTNNVRGVGGLGTGMERIMVDGLKQDVGYLSRARYVESGFGERSRGNVCLIW